MRSLLLSLFFLHSALTYESFPDPEPPPDVAADAVPLDVSSHPGWMYVDEERCGNSLSDRIIGGTNATIGQYPWLARIGYSTKKKPRADPMFRCGGSLITPCHVLTAAHCISGLPSDLYISVIRLGEFDADTDIDCDRRTCADPVQDFFPKRILVHKDYGNPPYKNDIAMLQLDRPAQLTTWVSPICLPRGAAQLTKNLVGGSAEVAGWGIYDLKISTGSRLLQTIRLPVVERSLCTTAFRKSAVVNDEQLCVGGVIGRDSCGGDSGGPLMKVDAQPGRSPRYYLFGVVSFGAKNCAATTMPAVYTKMASYLDWVLQHLDFCN